IGSLVPCYSRLGTAWWRTTQGSFCYNRVDAEPSNRFPAPPHEFMRSARVAADSRRRWNSGGRSNSVAFRDGRKRRQDDGATPVVDPVDTQWRAGFRV